MAHHSFSTSNIHFTNKRNILTTIASNPIPIFNSNGPMRYSSVVWHLVAGTSYYSFLRIETKLFSNEKRPHFSIRLGSLQRTNKLEFRYGNNQKLFSKQLNRINNLHGICVSARICSQIKYKIRWKINNRNTPRTSCIANWVGSRNEK